MDLASSGKYFIHGNDEKKRVCTAKCVDIDGGREIYTAIRKKEGILERKGVKAQYL